MNELSSALFGKEVLPNFQSPAKYTGELFGVEYLYNQSGTTFMPTTDADLVSDIDEGFGDIDEELDDPASYDDMTAFSPWDSEDQEEEVRISMYLRIIIVMHNK